MRRRRSRALTVRRVAVRKTPLKRRKPIPRQSPKRKALAGPRRAFVRRFLQEHPWCMVAWHPDCTGVSIEVHEALRRGKGGASIPGPKATRQGQKFWAVDRRCHDALTNPPSALFQALAIQEGWVMNQPENLR